MIQGEVHTLPLSDLIQWIALTSRTGTLAVTQGAQRIELYFAKGEIAGATNADLSVADSAEKVHFVLGSVLMRPAGHFVFNDGSLPKWVSLVNLHLLAEATLHNLTSQSSESSRPNIEPLLDEWAEAGKDFGLFTPADALRLQVVDQLLREDFSVPAMPELAVRVLKLTREKNFSLRELGNLVLTDQAIAARVLRYANSASQVTEKEVDSLAQAVHRLGADEVVSIVLAASLQARRLGQDLFATERHRLWVRSSTTAFLARSLAGKVGLERNLGFLCGLLMDFGMTILYTIIQDLLIRRASSKQFPTQDIKKIVRDFHPRVGRVVAEKWRLPSTVVEVMAYHHCLEQAPSNNSYVAVATLADFLANFALRVQRTELDEALASFPPERLVSHPAAKLINLKADGANAVLANLPRNLEQALEFVLP